MTNRDIAFGARPVGTISGQDYKGYMREVEFAAADTVAAFIGDFVKLTGEGSTDGHRPIVARCDAGDSPVGVLVALEPDFANESFNTPYREASTLRKAYICEGPDVLYEMQEDSDGGAMAAGVIGRNANFIVGSGNTTTGVSGMEIDSDTVNTTAALDLRIHAVADKPDNDIGANAIWLVSINTQAYRNTTGV